VLPMVVEQPADLEEELRPARERERAPLRECLLRRLDGGVDLFDAREVDRAALDTGRRVEDPAAAAGRPRRALAADPVVDRLDSSGCVDKFGHMPERSAL